MDCPWRNFCSFVKTLCKWWLQSVLTRKIRFMKKHKKSPLQWRVNTIEDFLLYEDNTGLNRYCFTCV